jgi:hypothetical protein
LLLKTLLDEEVEMLSILIVAILEVLKNKLLISLLNQL